MSKSRSVQELWHNEGQFLLTTMHEEPFFMIQSAEYLCLYAGMVLFALGIITLFIKHSWRLGIIFILMADLPLALAVAFPKKLAESFDSIGISFSSDQAKVMGTAIALITFIVLMYIYTRYIKRFFYRADAGQITEDDKNSTKESHQDVTKSSDRGEKKRDSMADPSLFANVKYNKE